MDPSDASSPATEVTGRRNFLKVGGLGAAVAAFAAACVTQNKVTDKMAQTGTLVPAPSTSEVPFPGSPEMDATFVLTAISLEKLLIATYQQVKSENWLMTKSYLAIVDAMIAQHDGHLPILEGMATQMGQDPNVDANQVVKTEEVDATSDTITSTDKGDNAKIETDAMTLLATLEDTIAQLYAKAGGEATTTALRAQFTSIGGTEARHYAVVAGAFGRPPAPFALEHTAPAALTDKAFIDPNKPVRSAGTTPGTTR